MASFNTLESILVKALAVVWAVVGVLAMLIFAVCRLSVYAETTLSSELTILQGVLLILSCSFMAYSEGYKGFYLSFSPRFAARVKYVYKEGSAIQMLLSPLFCFGYFGTTRAKQAVAIILTTVLVSLVVFMRYVPQPWRGIIDAGVVVGLSLGILSIMICLVKEFRSSEYTHDPQVPGLEFLEK